MLGRSEAAGHGPWNYFWIADSLFYRRKALPFCKWDSKGTCPFGGIFKGGALERVQPGALERIFFLEVSMHYENFHTAVFLERLNRFVARVMLDGEEDFHPF